METKTPPKETSKPEICQIRIVFPVDSDEQAIEYKKKIVTILSEIPDAQVHFSLMSMPAGKPNGTPLR